MMIAKCGLNFGNALDQGLHPTEKDLPEIQWRNWGKTGAKKHYEKRNKTSLFISLCILRDLPQQKILRLSNQVLMIYPLFIDFYLKIKWVHNLPTLYITL
jgi:hypothetical protein